MSRPEPDREDMLRRIEEQAQKVSNEVEALLAQIRKSRASPQDGATT